MTLLGSKKGYSKSDINFFEEFTASARKQTQVLAVVVFVGVIAIGISLAILAYDIFRNIGVQKDIDNLNATLASDEYAGLELRAQTLQREINEKNQYYYTLTEMRRFVDETNAPSTAVIHAVEACIPSSAYVTEYNVSGEMLTVSGLTFSYYDAANICHMLSESGVFTSNVLPAITEDSSLRGAATEENPIDVYYDFTVSGNLISEAIVSIGHYAYSDSSIIALSGVTTNEVAIGNTYEFVGVNSYTAGGVSYSLASVSINGNPVSSDRLSEIMNSDTISGVANGNIQISLYYNAVSSEPVEEGSEG